MKSLTVSYLSHGGVRELFLLSFSSFPIFNVEVPTYLFNKNILSIENVLKRRGRKCLISPVVYFEYTWLDPA